MMFITQYPSLHLENKTRARGEDFKLQLCLFMISIVPNYAGDGDDDYNDKPHILIDMIRAMIVDMKVLSTELDSKV